MKKTERKKLKKILGNVFIKDVQDILRKKNILNKKGNEYSVSYISNVFNGIEDNKDIEIAFYELANIRLEKEKELNKLKKIIQ
jgi:hypothetical protein